MSQDKIRDKVQDIYELSPTQQGFLFHTLYAPESGVYCTQLGCTLAGAVDLGAFRRAWQRAADRHPVLRTLFLWEKAGKPLQVVLRRFELPWEEEDWRALGPDEQDERLADRARAERERGFALAEAPPLRLTLLRLGDDRWRFLWTFHHILLDAWSMSVVFREIFAFYEAFRTGGDLELPAGRPYRDYIAWLRRQDAAEAEAWWRRALAGFAAPTPLGIDRPDADPYADKEYAARTFALPEGTAAALRGLAQRHRLTLSSLVQGIWTVLLGRYSGRREVLFGAAVSGRPVELSGVDAMVGHFAGVHPVRVRLAPEVPLLAALQEVQARQGEARRFEHCPLVQIQGWSEVPRDLPLFEALWVFENTPMDESLLERCPGLRVEDVAIEGQSSFPLTLLCDPRLTFRITWERARFDDAAIDRLGGHLAAAIDSVIARPGLRAGEVEVLSAAERQEILVAPYAAPAASPAEGGWAPGPGDAVLVAGPVRQPWLLRWLEERGARQVVSEGIEAEPLRQLLAGERITHLVLAPETAGALAAGRSPAAPDNVLRWVLLAGDPLQDSHPALLARRFGGTPAVLWATPEAAPEATLPAERGRKKGAPVPFVRPHQNAVLHVLADDLAPLPVAVAGEICLGGATLGPGDPVAPAAPAAPADIALRFVPDPWSPVPGARLFRTGDGGRRLEDGSVARLAPLAHHAWVGGLRIRLDEPEEALRAHPWLVDVWEQRLRALPEVEDAAIVLRPVARRIPPLHLSDLLPDWTRGLAAASAPARVAGAAGAGARLAVADGGPAPLQPGDPATLPELLRRAAERSPDAGTLYLRTDGSEVVQTYPELLADAERILGGLRRLGLRAGDRVLLQLELPEDFLSGFWGCVLGGFVPVPASIISGNPGRLRNAWESLGRPPVVASDALVPAILAACPEGRAAAIGALRAAPRDAAWAAPRPEDLAVLFLTSGSTGRPKAVRLTHANVVSGVAATARANGLTAGDVCLNWMPLDHPGPLIRCSVRNVWLGCRQIHAPAEAVLQQPLLWLDWMERHGVTVSWAPNFAYALVNEALEGAAGRAWNLSRLRSLINTGEAIVPATAARFRELLAPCGLRPEALQSSWGMAETSSGVTFATLRTDAGSSFVEVGPPVAGVALRIVDADDAPVAEGEIGRLQVRGAPVTSGYQDRPDLDRDAFTADGWFRTGDLGLLRQGRLTITGRESDVVIVNGANFYSHEIEAAVEEVPGVEVSCTAACAVREAGGDTDRLAIFFSPAEGTGDGLGELARQIRERVGSAVGVAPEILVPVEKAEVPRTSIGKIRRAALRERLAAGDFEPALKRVDLLLENAATVPDWFFRKVWRARDTGPAAPEPDGATLIVEDAAGLGRALRDALERNGRRVVSVAPDAADTAERLAALVRETPVREVVHLATWGPAAAPAATPAELERSLAPGLFGVLDLVQALAARGDDTPVRLLVVSSGAQAAEPADDLDLGRSPLPALVRTIPQELAWIDAAHVDLPHGSIEDGVRALRAELRCGQREPEVAWRGGRRLAPRLERADLARHAAGPAPFEEGGAYLLTGGLGGIGTEIARHLLRRHRARLLLAGRTPRPERLRSLSSLGGVRFAALDVADPEALRQAVEAAEAAWGRRLDGVLHLAGVSSHQLLTEADRATVAATLRPKVLGAWALHQVAVERPGALFVSFSSINGFFGGVTAGAYAAANRFLDALCRFQRARTSLRAFCLDWSLWDEVGMSRGYDLKEMALSRGYRAIAPAQGLQSLRAALWRDEPALLVGLDAAARHIQGFLDPPVRGGERLTVYFAAREPVPAARLAAQMGCGTLDGQDGDPFEIVQLDEMPRTPAGEIDRNALAGRTGGAAARTERVAPRTETEAKIAAIWQAVLGAGEIGVHDSFFRLGGHSLLATQILSRVRGAFEVEASMRGLFEVPTVAGMAERVDEALRAGRALQAPPLVPVPRERPLPLSFAQQRLWILHQWAPDHPLYNVPAAIRLTGRLDVPAVERALREIVRRHEVLRTTFAVADGEPVQVVHPEPALLLAREDLRGLPEDAREEALRNRLQTEAWKPFDLARGPLLRVFLAQLGDAEHVLLLTMHHIVSDGWSVGVLVHEVNELYRAFAAGAPAPLPELPVQYGDFAVWQRAWMTGEVLEEQLAWWRLHLAGAPTGVRLPADRPRPAEPTFAGGVETFELPRTVRDAFAELCREREATLFTVLLAAFDVLLFRYSGQEDVVVGSPVANRNRPEIEGLIGFFANTFVLRADLSGDPTFLELLGRVRDVTLGAQAHQDLPFERLVKELQPARNLSHTPLFDVMLVLQNAPLGELEGPGLTIAPVEIGVPVTHFGLLLQMWEGPETLLGSFTYSTEQFEAETVRRMARCFRTLCEGIAAAPGCRISELPLMSAEERETLHAVPGAAQRRRLAQSLKSRLQQKKAAQGGR